MKPGCSVESGFQLTGAWHELAVAHCPASFPRETVKSRPTIDRDNQFSSERDIWSAHTKFEGRVTFDYDDFEGNGGDCNGHDTHVASIAGGKTSDVVRLQSLSMSV
jgi:hypothetical protein